MRQFVDLLSERNLTGILVFGEDQFLQCLEGGRTEVNNLYGRILKDQRHEQTLLISYNQIPQREFEEWNMKLVIMGKKTKKLLRRFSESDEFNPSKMNSSSAFQFLLALRDQSG